MRSIYELIGIVKGISYDGIINDREVVRLQDWADKNRNFTFDSKEVELVKVLAVQPDRHLAVNRTESGIRLVAEPTETDSLLF